MFMARENGHDRNYDYRLLTPLCHTHRDQSDRAQRFGETACRIGPALGGVATFFGTEAVKYYYYERDQAVSQVKEARAAIDPFLHPLPGTVRESDERIIGLRGKRLLFQSDEAKALFALAIGHLDEYREGLREQEIAAAREKRLRLAARTARNEAAAQKARRAAAVEAEKVDAAKKAVTAVSRTISKFATFSTKLPFQKR
jgi:hypothetical protein